MSSLTGCEGKDFDDGGGEDNDVDVGGEDNDVDGGGEDNDVDNDCRDEAARSGGGGGAVATADSM